MLTVRMAAHNSASADDNTIAQSRKCSTYEYFVIRTTFSTSPRRQVTMDRNACLAANCISGRTLPNKLQRSTIARNCVASLRPSADLRTCSVMRSVPLQGKTRPYQHANVHHRPSSLGVTCSI